MQDWLQVAKALPYGQRTKIECCAADKSCIVEHSAKGYRAWCFRCDPQTPIRFVPHGLRSLAELSVIREATNRLLNTRDVSLPTDYTTELPVPARLWLLKAGISNPIRHTYGIGYSPALNRVVLPVRTTDQLNAVLLRSITDRPKYIIRARSDDEVFLSDPATLLPSAKTSGTVDAFDIVITEDVLSAIRVGRHTASGALLGTAIGAGRVHKILRKEDDDLHTGRVNDVFGDAGRSRRIGLWLDPDKAGRTSASRLLSSLTLQGHTCIKIRSEKDPKYYSDNQIRDILLARRSAAAGDEEPEGVPVSL